MYNYYVYVIGNNADKNFRYFSGCIKIGMTSSVKKRIKTLQTATANKLEIILVIGFRTKIEASVVEIGLHELFKFHKVKNEWFLYNEYTHEKLYKLQREFFNNLTRDFL